MTEAEKDLLTEQRLDFLMQTHRAGSFDISFDPDAQAITIRSGFCLMIIPADQIKPFITALSNIDTILFITGITK